MPEATEKQLEREVRNAFREFETLGWSEPDFNPTIREIMETVRRAWIFGRDAGYREATLTNNN